MVSLGLTHVTIVSAFTDNDNTVLNMTVISYISRTLVKTMYIYI